MQIYRTSVPDIVPFPEGCDLLQVLWCPQKHSGHRWIVPRVQWRKASSVGKVLETPPTPADAWENYVPRPCVVHPELVTEYPYWDLRDDMWDELEFRFLDLNQETGWDYQSHLSTAPGTKLGGYPGWCQDPEWPGCVECGNRMEHLLTVESTEADAVSRRTWTPLEEGHTEPFQLGLDRVTGTTPQPWHWHMSVQAAATANSKPRITPGCDSWKGSLTPSRGSSTFDVRLMAPEQAGVSGAMG
ncbi:hypothetical protein [Streptomyces sp. NPDC058291]|uniref:hypothetical protein n=1 Tax=Streptomyces sp. NPDC058291 TaxID=3346427 RepID=UPI0036E4C7F0